MTNGLEIRLFNLQIECWGSKHRFYLSASLIRGPDSILGILA